MFTWVDLYDDDPPLGQKVLFCDAIQQTTAWGVFNSPESGQEPVYMVEPDEKDVDFCPTHFMAIVLPCPTEYLKNLTEDS